MNLIYSVGNFCYKALVKCHKEILRKKILNKYDIHKSVNFWATTFITGEGSIIIGENSYIGQNTYVSANPIGSKITIGQNCAISHNIQIRTGTYNIKEFIQGNRVISFKDIEIGNNVWIGANSFISGGVVIGDNVIIAANSFVNSSFGNNCVIGGTPAKLIKNV